MKNILLVLLVVSSINVFSQREYSETLTNNLDVYSVKSEFERKASNYATSIMYKFGGENNLKHQYFDVKTGNYEKKIRGYMEDGKILGGLGLYVEWQDYGKEKCIVLVEMVYDMYNNSQNFSYRILNTNESVKKYNNGNGLLVAVVGLIGIYGAYQAIKTDNNSNKTSNNSYSNSNNSTVTKTQYPNGSYSQYNKNNVAIISFTTDNSYVYGSQAEVKIRNKNTYSIIVKISVCQDDGKWFPQDSFTISSGGIGTVNTGRYGAYGDKLIDVRIDYVN